jgi:hypothetical protein
MAEKAITTGTSGKGAEPASGSLSLPPTAVAAPPALEPELPALLLDPPPDTVGGGVCVCSPDVQATNTPTRAALRRSHRIAENPIVSE